MAAAFQEPPGNAEQATTLLKAALERAIADGKIDPFCGLCKATRDHWTFEVAQLPGRTLEEVMPALRASEAEQQHSAAAIKAEQRAANN